MKTKSFVLFLLTFLGSHLQAQNFKNSIIGNWKLYSVGNKKSYECPDQINFLKDKTYSVLNDCYGRGVKDSMPIIENGNWEITDSCIYLQNRNYKNNYLFKPKSLSVKFFVELITQTSLTIIFTNNGKKVKEEYKKTN